MAKRKSDEQLQNELHQLSRNALELSGKSHKVHMSALNLTEPAAHRKAMQTAIGLQKLSVEEMKRVTRIQRTLLNRQIKMLNGQKEKYLKS